MSGEKHVITYPGFAEHKSAKGLFDDIELAASSRYTFHQLPFYEEDQSGNRIVHSIDRHATLMQEYIDGLDGKIIMLAKCGGSRVVASMDDSHIGRLSKLCLFNPPYRASKSLLMWRIAEQWSGQERADGSWAVPRGSGASYIVTADYIQDATGLNLLERYRQIASSDTPFYIVRGLEDEVIPPIDVGRIKGAHAIDIESGDHHFVNGSRSRVIGALFKRAILIPAEDTMHDSTNPVII
jgi:hypothetical protein